MYILTSIVAGNINSLATFPKLPLELLQQNFLEKAKKKIDAIFNKLLQCFLQ